MKRVLIIEDEVSLNEALKQALISAGFEIEQAYNGVEALTKSLDNDFNVILLDLLMPVKDGFEFLEDYLSKKAEPAPILVLTNLSDFSSQMKTYKKGVVSYMVKSNVSLEEIVKRVSSLVL